MLEREGETFCVKPTPFFPSSLSAFGRGKSFLIREGTRDPDLSQSVHPIPVATVIGGGMVIPPNGS